MADQSPETETSFNDDDEIHGPRATVHEVLACQFSSWYPTFSNILPLNPSGGDNGAVDSASQKSRSRLRKNVTIPSIIIEDLPMPEFKNYLLSDGVKLPKGATKLSSCAGVTSKHEESDNDDDENDVNFHFPELNERILETIKERFPSAGAVIPKLNWSAPRDATWINEGTLKCKTPGDVYLLLKSSDFCTHDVLYHSLQDCRDYNNTNENGNEDCSSSSFHNPPPLQLILRKWCNLNPSMEFRCFIRRHELLGISQRQHSVHFPHLKQDRDRFFDLIYDFFEDYVKHRFADRSIGNYVVDVFLDKKDRIWIIDFNPWARTTDPLLYEWSELTSMDDGNDGDDEGIRIALSEKEVRHDPLSSYRAPIDTVDLASMTHGDAKQFEEFMKLCQRPTYWEENSDDDES